MQRAAAGRFSVVRRLAGPRRAPARTDPEGRAGVRPPVFLELQWQGRGGTVRHLALTPRGVRRVLGTSGIVALLALAVVGALAVRSDRFPRLFGADPVVRENTELKARRDTLRSQAFDLAARLDERVELARTMLGMAEAPAHAWEDQSLRLPAKDVGDDVLIAWISAQEARLEALENELVARRMATSGKQASATAPGNRLSVPPRGAAMLQVAGLDLTGPQEAAPTRR
jgi:hypothetical protein